MTTHTPAISWLPAIAGTGLCMGAIGLLCSDALTTGHLTITHALQPLLVLGTVAAAVLAHKASWRSPLTCLLFLSLAALGSLATIYGTLGRQADTRDAKVGAALAENRTLELRLGALETAKQDAARECKSGVGSKCANASARVDKLVGEMRELRTVSPDPRADAIADLFHLVASADKVRTRQIVSAVDPLVLPLFLELGSILFFAVAFPRRAARVSTPLDGKCVETVNPRAWSRADALRDFQRMRSAPSQQVLAARWGVSEGCVSKWVSAWEVSGAVRRLRDGREKACLALPAPR